jgi:hypothetical protein
MTKKGRPRLAFRVVQLKTTIPAQMDMEFRMVLRKRQMTLQEGVRQAVGMWLAAYAKVDGYGVKTH